ncbi:uncharacterized protein LOC119796687 [Cyprinodon tularosa]|uniref:uncharacterized protein LOC119796687 n=1 Tax=Cyprinodon tularosa TaxID=77115 RepID=UPI0018E26A0E|nr:uncharacterized protein LOC119796687 [Cyprinodon tularosa]
MIGLFLQGTPQNPKTSKSSGISGSTHPDPTGTPKGSKNQQRPEDTSPLDNQELKDVWINIGTEPWSTEQTPNIKHLLPSGSSQLFVLLRRSHQSSCSPSPTQEQLLVPVSELSVIQGAVRQSNQHSAGSSSSSPALPLSLTPTFQPFTPTKQELRSQSDSLRCDQVWVVMTMLSWVQRMMGKPSSLTGPKGVLKETKRSIYGKPPRHQIGAAQSFFVMSVFTAAMLAPAAWILYHLPEYRERARQAPRP